MPRLNVDSEAFGDWRFERLGQLAGIDTFSAFGRAMHVWHFGLSQLRDVLTADEIDGVSRMTGFSGHMEAAQLAERKPEGFRIRGLAARMAWLEKLKASSRSGGEANRKRIESCKASQVDSHIASPLSLALAPSLSPALESKEKSSPANAGSPPVGSKPRKQGEPKREPPSIPPEIDSPAFRAVWEAWNQHRREKRTPLTPTAARSQLRKLARLSPELAIEALENSISNGYTGVFTDRYRPAKTEPPVVAKPKSEPLPPEVVAEYQERQRLGAAERAKRK